MRRLREVALTAGAVIGSLVVVATLLCLIFDVRPVVVDSGSMSPAIPAGSLAFGQARPAADARVGQVVMVTAADGVHVMHRVVATTQVHGRTELRLKGDANPVPDAQVYTVDTVRVIRFHIPDAGYPVTWLGTPLGLVGLGAVGVLLLRYAFRRDPRGGRRKAAAALVVPVALVSTTTPGAEAAYTDSSAITSGTVTAYTVPAPTVSCGVLGVGSVTINWTAVPSASGYVIHYGTGGNTSATVSASTTSYSISGVATTGTFYVQTQRSVGSTTWTSGNSNQVQYQVILLAVGICNLLPIG